MIGGRCGDKPRVPAGPAPSRSGAVGLLSFDMHNPGFRSTATITPNSGLRGLNNLLELVLLNRSHGPTCRGVGLRFFWVNQPCTAGSEAVPIDGARPSADPLGYIRRNVTEERQRGASKWRRDGWPG